MVIAHLYKDLLNLYGNDGNVKILKAALEELGCEVSVVAPSLGDALEWDKYDLVFIGSGTESNQEMALSDIEKYKEDIKKAIDSGKVILAMGNSIDMFGGKMMNAYDAGEEIEALGIFPFNSEWTVRIRQDVRRESIFTDGELLGFENHNYKMVDEEGNELPAQEIQENNFFGSYVEGPILVRNPGFLKKIAGLLVGDKADSLDLSMEERAYDNFIKILDMEEK